MTRKNKFNFKTILRYGLIVVGVFALVFAGWVFYLDGIVTKQFEGRRWSLPAQVFAQPLELYAGQQLSADALEQELRRLGYQKSDTPTRPGSYRRRGLRIDFVAREFRFVDELRAAQAVSVLTGGTGIERLWDGKGNELPLFRLDPLLIGSIFPIHGEDRVVVAPDQVPELLPTALKIVEDRKFDTHWGVNPWAIARAMWVNLRAGQIEQGGSTLTQQLVKSYFLDNRRTLGRKLEEAVMAVLLEVHFEKDDLMNAYINEIHLGQEGNRAIHGFGLASQFYFGKPLNELQLQEIATLVTIARGPSYYDPRRHADRVKERRDRILDMLADFKVVSAATARTAKSKPLDVRLQGSLASSYYPAFMDLVRRTVRRDYREEDLTETGLRIFSTLDPRVQAQAENALTTELVALDKRTKRTDAQLEGVVVVTTPQNGEAIAIVGGRRVSFDGYNRALDAKRSVGSLVKPVIFLAAMESGRYNATSVIDDSPLEVKLTNGTLWKPQNITKEYYGPVPLVRTLAQSLNVASARLGMDVGVTKVTKAFTQLGLEKEPPPYPSVLLGSLDIAPIDVAQMYNSLANGGFRTPLRAVRAVVDAQGTPLKAFQLEVTQVADPLAVYQVNRMMQVVMENGSGRYVRARLPKDMIVAGKTGTSSDYRDTWFAGFSGAHLAVVWVGYDDDKPTGLTGASGAMAVWARFFNTLQTRPWNEPVPEGLIELTVDFATGEAAPIGCTPEVVTVVVPQGTQIPPHAACGSGFSDRMVDWLRGIMR